MRKLQECSSVAAFVLFIEEKSATVTDIVVDVVGDDDGKFPQKLINRVGRVFECEVDIGVKCSKI